MRNYWEITQTSALIIPHILREPNSIIVLLFFVRRHKLLIMEQHEIVWKLDKPVRLRIFLKQLSDYKVRQKPHKL